MVEMNRQLSELHEALTYEVRIRTTMLMYALAGVHLYPQTHSPRLPGIFLMPILATDHDYAGLREDTVQLVFKGWVEDVYGVWENYYRNQIKAVFAERTEDAIAPEMDAWGDFRHIRNDLVHNNGVASAGETGKCAVLRWFSVGENIVLNFHHVLDFLNQVAAMDMAATDRARARTHTWWLSPYDEEDLRQHEPIIISVRAGEGPTEDSLGVSVVFDNGVFGCVPLYREEKPLSREEVNRLARQVQIIEKGRALWTGIRNVSATALYNGCLIGRFHPETGVRGPGLPSPWIRISRDNSEGDKS